MEKLLKLYLAKIPRMSLRLGILFLHYIDCVSRLSLSFNSFTLLQYAFLSHPYTFWSPLSVHTFCLDNAFHSFIFFLRYYDFDFY